ncbi:hypothetical protein IC235_11790 [Hymenobacter sp. BT664]|uniref:Uncharacterized protein n=1 Tax=Hymenobacter montanus TaxID=2771359 RepID=A0A927BEM3_9BACT|nr:hypothetical protein [Hymenobacter montanus]MBD2768568.1 hypothetical protein [Hymenobacter montanus]
MRTVPRSANYINLTSPASAADAQVRLLSKKVDLLTQKVKLLSQGRTELPNTKAIDDQLAQLEAQPMAPD